MKKREQYHLFFQKIKSGKFFDYDCYTNSPYQDYARLASKLSIMHTEECQGLIDSIEDAEKGIYEFFALDADSASDDDEIHIFSSYIIIDKIITIPFQDMKELLQEWMSFQSS